MAETITPPVAPGATRLPVVGLSALAMAGFLTILTEALPAGLLPLMSSDLGVSEAMVGQLVTAYAIGSLVAAIPLTAATRTWRRRPLLMLAMGGFLVVNAVTASSTDYRLMLAARFIAGLFAGLVWSLLAGYAGRMAPEHLRGRAISIAMVGAPLALSIGIPAGTLLGGLVGWRPVFTILSGLSVVLVGWIAWKVPDFEGEAHDRRLPLAEVIALPGLKTVLAVTLGFVLAHNILYTYVAPFLARSGLASRTDAVLLLFGLAALVGIWIVGSRIDRSLRTLTQISIAAFCGAGLVLAILGDTRWAVLVAVSVWGVAFGGAASLFQTASARISGKTADVAQSMIVTAWNLAIAGGGVLGGLLLQSGGAAALPWSLVGLLAFVGLLVLADRKTGFA
ncbi:MFS transporter [Methylobacterium bullatum]|uniref:Purine efflux pump PbuE n=1 Tax=Methylobacterium bullatum TaxID=570505 RepID=A0AAV4ZAC0_9HYPH|nr:MFS transporter [Methylobacterium bullatum]MBD8904301.1 MFS transporter [Methylobacterium bullatum]GJD40469.1 Purine efflux pump PbuE [Methylobacterium bullatum]